MDQLHEQKFTSLLANAPSDVVEAHFCSYASPTTKAWLLVRPNTLSFCLPFAHFLIAFHIHLNIPHPTITHLSQC
jgi:hypothetical protein